MTGKVPEECRSCRGECLKNVEFLVGLPPEKVTTLLRRAVRLTLPKGGCLFREGEACDAIYIIHRGRVKLSTYDQDGLERIAGIFVEHDTMWEGVLVPDSRYSASAIAMTEVEYCKLARKDFEEAIQEPEVAMRIIALLSKKHCGPQGTGGGAAAVPVPAADQRHHYPAAGRNGRADRPAAGNHQPEAEGTGTGRVCEKDRPEQHPDPGSGPAHGIGELLKELSTVSCQRSTAEGKDPPVGRVLFQILTGIKEPFSKKTYNETHQEVHNGDPFDGVFFIRRSL